jgi:hypothetical protein
MSIVFSDSCFGQIIGITRSECDCRDIPVEATVSDSDLFLFDLPGLHESMIDALEDCDNAPTVFESAATAINEAVSTIKTDLLSCLRSNQRLKVARPAFTGEIGDKKKAKTLIDLNYAYHGMKMQVADVRGGYMILRKIGIWANQTVALMVSITDNIGEVSETEVVNCIANTFVWHTLATPLEVTLNNPGGGGYIEYYLTYEPPANFQVRNIELHCGCGGGFKPYYDVSSPQFNKEGDKGNFGYANWCSVGGTYGDDLAEADEWTTSSQTQGMMLDVEFGCRADSIICREAMNYNSDPFAAVIAHATRYKAGGNLLRALSTSANINLGALADGQARANLMREYATQYNDRVFDWLCPQIALPGNINQHSDCMSCRNQYGFVKGGIKP